MKRAIDETLNEIEKFEKLQVDDLTDKVNVVKLQDCDIFPILDLPLELASKVYSYLDHETRRALSENAIMESIREDVELKFETLTIVRKKDEFHVSYGTVQRIIPYSEMAKELEALATNKSFERVFYEAHGLVLPNKKHAELLHRLNQTGIQPPMMEHLVSVLTDRNAVTAIKFIKAKNIEITDPNFGGYDEILSAVQNRESLFADIYMDDILDDSNNLYMKIYEYFKVNLAQEGGLQWVRIQTEDEDTRQAFMNKLKISGGIPWGYVCRDPNLKMCEGKHEGEIHVIDGPMKIVIQNYAMEWGSLRNGAIGGYVQFEKFVEKETKGEQVIMPM